MIYCVHLGICQYGPMEKGSNKHLIELGLVNYNNIVNE